MSNSDLKTRVMDWLVYACLVSVALGAVPLALMNSILGSLSLLLPVAFLIPPCTRWVSTKGIPIERLPLRWRQIIGLAGLIFSSALSLTSIELGEQQARLEAFKADPAGFEAEVIAMVRSSDIYKATLKVDDLLAHGGKEDIRLIGIRERILVAELDRLRTDQSESRIRQNVEAFRKVVPKPMNAEAIEAAVGEVVVSGIDRLAATGNFVSADRLIQEMAALFPHSSMPEELRGLLKEVRQAYEEEQRRQAEVKRLTQEREARERERALRREIITGSSSEDPRNTYIYCLSGTFTCFQSPAECKDQLKYYNSPGCKSVACGTGESVANTTLCSRKGYR